MKLTVLLLLLVGVSGCASLQERLAKRIGCDQNKLVVNSQVHAPAYTQYNVTCDGKKYVCRNAPFYEGCDLDVPKDKK